MQCLGCLLISEMILARILGDLKPSCIVTMTLHTFGLKFFKVLLQALFHDFLLTNNELGTSTIVMMHFIIVVFMHNVLSKFSHLSTEELFEFVNGQGGVLKRQMVHELSVSL